MSKQVQIKKHGIDNSESLLLSDKEVSRLLGISKPWIWKHTRLGNFPEPVRFGSRCTRWRKADILAWVENL